jgi:hypothetical protein
MGARAPLPSHARIVIIENSYSMEHKSTLDLKDVVLPEAMNFYHHSRRISGIRRRMEILFRAALL